MSATKLPPSPAKLRKLQKDGVFAVSPLLTKELAQVVLIAGILSSTAHIASEMVNYLRSNVALIWYGFPVEGTSPPKLAAAISIPAIAALIAAACVSIVVRSWKMSFPTPSIKNLKPFAGFLQRFQRDGVTTTAVKVLTAALPLVVAFAMIQGGLRGLMAAGLEEPASPIGASLSNLLVIASVAGLAGALFDQVLRVRAFLDKHGMAPHEAKQEHREQEGSPEMKAAQHQARMELMYAPPARAMLAADVVIRNPTHIAVVITGVQSESPWILMSGQDDRAKELIRLAQRFDRPTVRSVQLARQLHQCSEGSDVPAQLIRAVTDAARWAHELRDQSSR